MSLEVLESRDGFSASPVVAYIPGAMESNLLEVHTGTVTTFDGQPHQVEGGVYLTPEAYLHTTAELEQLRQKREAEDSSAVPALVVGAALVGLLTGFWLGRRGRSEE